MSETSSLLNRLAEVAIRVGVNLLDNQELIITAPLSAVALARALTEHAYDAGASLVTTLFTDEDATLTRYRRAREDSFDRAPEWLDSGIASAYRSGAARLAIAAGDPLLLSQQNPAKVARANIASWKSAKPAIELITRHEFNWSIVPFPSPAWARVVFPDVSETAAVDRLWHAIAAITRIDTPDPIAAWRTHDAALHQRADYLNAKRFAALHFTGPGTDLHLGLADDHQWLGGGTLARNGAYCLPNVPTEEVFTTPHKDRVHGVVSASKPLSHQGALIDKIQVRFENGRIVHATAATGDDLLRRLLATDEGAARLGEVGVVPNSSPISQTGLLFWSTLLDENAATHIALGKAYSGGIRNGDTLTADELASRGANDSLIHIDWMIGSGEMNIDGIPASGAPRPVMRNGEWVDAL